MSTVWKAEDLRLSRLVAVKFSKQDRSVEFTERLFREAKAAARANHPAVITVFGYGTDNDTGLHYLVMELLHGEDLAVRLARETRLATAVLLRMAAEIADALARVHETGVVHRDLKPANIFLARRGLRIDEVKLLDFGVARQFDLQSLTATGEVLGTLAYMAPEQLLDSKCVDPRCDIYALGVVMFECLFGRRPYEAETLAQLAQHILNEDGPPLDLLSHLHLPPALVQIVLQCLRRDPHQRFASARLLCDALLALNSLA